MRPTRAVRTSAAAVPALVLAGILASETARVPVAVRPMDDEAVRGVSTAELRRLLEKRLDRTGSLSVADPEDAQAAFVEVERCVRVARARGRSRSQKVRGGLPGDGRTREAETRIEAELHAGQEIELVMRVGRGERYALLRSSPRDTDLTDAVDTVVRQAADWLALEPVR